MLKSENRYCPACKQLKRDKMGKGTHFSELHAKHARFSGIVDANKVNSLLQRELKISGYIGEQGRPDQFCVPM